ncbi:MAG: ATP-binding cassette domain-containing protein [Phascolarctobacterium sp.]|nr:ATP-binding cassette domain-containing protein [Candidatus Phascolarctobacterium caballi]
MADIQYLQLNIGERFDLSEERKVCRIISGKVEVYAVAKESKERLYLRTKVADQFIFAFCDEFAMVEVSLLVQETTKIIVYNSNAINKICNGIQDETGLDILTLRRGMQEWFLDFMQLEWLNCFASYNDEVVSQWTDGKFIMQAEDEKLLSVFKEHHNILILLITGQFESQKSFFKNRLAELKNRQKELITNSLELISGSNESYRTLKNSEYEDYGILVAKVAKFFKMKGLDLTVPEYIKKRLQSVELLKYVIRKGDMRFRKVILEKDWFKKDTGVLFVNRKGNWQLALPAGTNSYNLWDVDRHCVPLTDKINDELDESALICYPGFTTDREVGVKEFLKFIYNTTWHNDYLVILLASIVLGVIPLLTPIITDTIFSDVIPTNNYGNLATITQVMLVSSFSAAVLTVVRSVAVVRIVTHMGILVEAALWSRLLSLPTSFFKKYSVGELITRMLSFMQAKNILTGQFVAGIFNFVFGLWSLVLMFCYSVKLSLIAVGIWTVYFLLSFFNLYKYPMLQKNLLHANNEQSALTVELVNNLGKFRSKGGTEQAFYLWSQKFSNCWRHTLKMRWMNNRNELLNVCLSIVLMLVLYCFAAYDVQRQNPDAIDATKFMAFNVAYTGFNMALLQLMPDIIQMIGIPAYWDNFSPLLQEKTETGNNKIEAGELTGEIELRRVAFSYDQDGPEVLKDINIHIKPGEKVAFVGGSGCGKSTIVRLLLGFEKPTKGLVMFDNSDFGELDTVSVRKQMGVVLQNGKLLMAPILQNIIGTNNLTIDDAWEAAKLVALDKDIEEMPMGMHTLINDSSGNISGGQRQRILLARSIVNKPKILILDEATSALDNVTQAIVAENLAKMHCTQIIIAHRLSTLKDADRIFVLDKGVVTEEGSYAELMALGGLFSQLAKRQIT